jgi:hypothetical protein
VAPEIRYAKSGDVHIAYQVFGNGPGIIIIPGFISHIEHSWDSPDKAWRELLQAHDAKVRREMARFRGSEVKSLGDGFLILFDGPARAIIAPRQSPKP